VVTIRAKLHADGLNTVKFVRIDVTDLASIQAAKETIDQEDKKLDVLVNNAGTFFFISTFKFTDLKKNVRYR
jgi:NAD(P)-dependent dehydrogenase (short-subunit alcohol dehydrogenase family)